MNQHIDGKIKGFLLGAFDGSIKSKDYHRVLVPLREVSIVMLTTSSCLLLYDGLGAPRGAQFIGAGLKSIDNRLGELIDLLKTNRSQKETDEFASLRVIFSLCWFVMDIPPVVRMMGNLSISRRVTSIQPSSKAAPKPIVPTPAASIR